VYARFKDTVGNISTVNVGQDCPTLRDPTKPEGDDNPLEGCCQSYSIKLQDLQDFINESRLIDVTSTGQVVYSYDSPSNIPIYSGDKIDVEHYLFL
jgi:hypothetical protein